MTARVKLKFKTSFEDSHMKLTLRWFCLWF